MSSEAVNTPAEELDENYKAQMAEYERGVRIFTRIQAAETAKVKTDEEWKNLGSKSDKAYRDFVRRTAGFDPL